ncbi:hypothetical protein GGX14DRAFT_598670 [Mycena pura]|uniref:Velvet domain-containing protein n=1 Tax=Mycena pura TaxID=153505 RepID=A0AAD6VVE7_9AGAR|nr:hypothetical protein GGX14DRAFT_598670 [Mycena pura]
MSVLWHLEELQSPVAARKSSVGAGPRPLDPLPVVRMLCSSGGQYIEPHGTANFSLRALFCVVDLFRLPDEPVDPRPGFTYYFHEGGFDRSDFPVFVLLRSEHPPRDIGEHRVGNHLLLGTSTETHLLYGNSVAQAYEHPETKDILFPFPNMGVLQTGRYLMRYQVCDRRQSPIVARCYGTPFTVFDATQFPGLEPSTPFTESLAPLNVPGLRIRRQAPVAGGLV